ncbi:Type I restriction-modification system methyltransferase subunit [Bacteroidales bacterium Barb7]|nr:Type I restriction-modification system methyltransferase subunit [Bacteroidales bacterium Barb7]
MNNKKEFIIHYYQKVKSANKELTKKETFKDLLNRLYFGNAEIQGIIDKMTLGAEATVVNIPRKDKLHKGSADTLYNNIIIEFENDLRVTYKHAKEQLAGYLLGKIRSGAGYDFTLIASDFITWKVVVPDISCIDKLDTLQEHELILNETESSFVLTEENAEDFYFWLDRFLFRENKQKATLKNVEEAFGCQSAIFIESFRQLDHWFNDAKKYGEIQVSHEQWHRFLSIAYGAFDSREDAFLIHTYLSVFSKMLAHSVVSNNDYIDDDEMLNILNGSIFHKYNISNFVDNDFFHWVSGERDFPKLKKIFRLVAQELSAFDFENVNEDILKGVYQELIDLDTRHRLGEYYTPDWLCERIVNEFNFKKHNKILDPSCGSGSFLRAAVSRIRILNPEITAEEISEQIYGIDIHPLSVQIAKTTLLLSLGRGIIKARKPIQLNILIANTLYSPINEIQLFGTEFEMPIDKDKYLINSQVLDNVEEFNKALDVCDRLSANALNSKSVNLSDFGNIIKKQISINVNEQIIESYFNIYKGFKKAKEDKRDGIWKFIIANQYKPYFLYERFDYVIGNPPWFTYSSVNSEDYQNVLNTLAVKYNVKPTHPANYPHLEIAAIFLAHCSSYFLNTNGKLAFVLPRSFFSGDQHDHTRSDEAKGFRITEIWDMNDVQPLFRIPCCVIFSEKKPDAARKTKQTKFAGKQFAGRLPAHNCHYDIAEQRLTENALTWYLIKQGKATAFSANKSSTKNMANPYKLLFKQGATIVPRAFYFIDLNQDTPDDFLDRIINVKTAADIKTDTKAPWKLHYSGQIESRFIFRTAIAKSILPFYLYNPAMVTLPITIETDEDNNKKIVLHTAEQLMNAGELDAWKWFANAERIWKISKTEKNKNINSSDYLNWLNKLTDQNLNARYLVLYNASAKDANALVVDRKEVDLEFIVESKAYVFYTNDEFESYYLSTILNSSTPNKLMKDFQTKGLFGARDVHKKILDIYFPKYNKLDALHTQLAILGADCHTLAKEFVSQQQYPQNLTAHGLGKVRLEIKKHLSVKMAETDKLVKKLL